MTQIQNFKKNRILIFFRFYIDQQVRCEGEHLDFLQDAIFQVLEVRKYLFGSGFWIYFSVALNSIYILPTNYFLSPLLWKFIFHRIFSEGNFKISLILSLFPYFPFPLLLCLFPFFFKFISTWFPWKPDPDSKENHD